MQLLATSITVVIGVDFSDCFQCFFSQFIFAHEISTHGLCLADRLTNRFNIQIRTRA